MKKHSDPRRAARRLAVLAAGLLFLPMLSTLADNAADTHFYEPYDYATGAMAFAGGGIWVPSANLWSGTASIVGVKTFGTYHTSIGKGNAIQTASGNSISRTYALDPAPANGDTVWLSVLNWRTGDNYWGGWSTAVIGNVTITCDPSSENRGKTRVRLGTSDSAYTTQFRSDGDKNAYLFIVRLTNHNNASDGDPQTATLWVFNATAFNNLMGETPPFTSVMLDTHAIRQTAATRTTPVSIASGTVTLNANGGTGYGYDELRACKTLDAILGAIDLPTIVLPDDPANIAVAEGPAETLSVVWDVCANATAYIVERKTGVDGSYEQLTDTLATEEYVDAGRAAATAYRYRITAKNDDGFSAAIESAWFISAGSPEPMGTLLFGEAFLYPNVADNTLVSGGTLDRGTGWTSGSAWTASSASPTFQATGLTFSDYPVEGGAVRVPSGTNVKRSLRYPPAVGSTVWVSYLCRRPSQEYGHYARQVFEGTDYASKFVAHLGTWDSDGGLIRVDVDNNNPNTGANGQGLGSSPLLVIAKYTNVGAHTGGNPQRGTLWILNATDYDAIKAGGILEAELDLTRRIRTTDTSAGLRMLFEDDFMVFSANGINPEFDEIKVGTTLTTVLSPLPPPPGAGTLILLL